MLAQRHGISSFNDAYLQQVCAGGQCGCDDARCDPRVGRPVSESDNCSEPIPRWPACAPSWHDLHMHRYAASLVVKRKAKVNVELEVDTEVRALHQPRWIAVGSR